MSDLVTCPNCSRKLKVGDELRGQALRCPSCGTTFEPDVPEDEERIQKRDQESVPPQRSRRAAAEEPRGNEPCPACGKPIPPNVLRCPACKADLEFEDNREWERGYRSRRDSEPHRGALVLTLGIISVVLPGPSICCSFFGIIPALIALALGGAAWRMGATDLKKMKAHTMDTAGYGQTQGGMICGIVGTVLSIIFTLIMIGVILFWGALMMDIRNQAAPMPVAPPPVVKPAQPAVKVPELLPPPTEQPLNIPGRP